MPLPYITPDRFRALGYGNDLNTLQDFELASILDRATALVNQYCHVPTLPQFHDFRGGIITNEAHQWRTNSFRVYPWHQPVKELTSFRIYATNSVYIDIQPNEMFIQDAGRYLEIVALSLTPVGFWAASGLISLREPVARMNYTYGWDFPVVGETLYATDATEFSAQNQFWKTTPAPVVYVNGTEETSGFSIDYNEGAVIFDDALAPEDTVTVDYTYPLPSAIAQATGLIASQLISERDLISKGMGDLMEIQVEEVRLRRQQPRIATLISDNWADVPDTARGLLGPYRFITAMGS